MTVKDASVTFFVLGLMTGMIVAFASCSADPPDPSRQQQTTQHYR